MFPEYLKEEIKTLFPDARIMPNQKLENKEYIVTNEDSRPLQQHLLLHGIPFKKAYGKYGNTFFKEI